MPNDGTGTGWDEANPADSNPLGQGAREIRDIRIGLRLRMSKEHNSLGITTAGGEHKKGSARAYFQSTAPTTRPGSGALDAADDGRIFYNSVKKQFQAWDGSEWKVARAAGSTVFISDRKTAGVDGGTFTSGAWRTRTNWGVASAGNPGNYDNLITILGGSNEQFRLVAGIWRFHITCPAFRVNEHKAMLYNVTDAEIVLQGTSEWSAVEANYAQTRSIIFGEAEIDGDTTFEVRHRCGTTRATDGFGKAANLDSEPEVFSTALITRIE